MPDGTPASARPRHAWRRSHPYPRGISPDTRCALFRKKLCTHGLSHRRAKRRIAFRPRQRDHFSARVGSLVPPVAHSCIGMMELISLAPRAQPPSWPRPARLLMCARVWPASTLPGEAARQRGSAAARGENFVWVRAVHAVGSRAEPKSRRIVYARQAVAKRGFLHGVAMMQDLVFRV
jgi:hypothetical protein